MVAVDPDNNPITPSSQFTARVAILKHPNIINPGLCAFCYCHTSTFQVKFVEFLDKLDPRTGKSIEVQPKSIKKGDQAIILMETDKKICVEPYSKCPPLGRFALTESNSILGVGVILSVKSFQPVLKSSPKDLTKKIESSIIRGAKK